MQTEQKGMVHSQVRAIASARIAMNVRRAIFSAAFLAGVGLGSLWARGDSASTQPSSLEEDNAELRREVRELTAKVDRIEAQQEENATSAPSVAQSVQAEADKQTQIISTSDFRSGYNSLIGFVIQSENGAFSLHPGAVLDIRYMANYRENVPKNSGTEVGMPGNDWESGFDLTRVRLTFDGKFTSHLNYFIQFEADQGTPLSLLDAYGIYHLDNSPFSIKFGQFKDPVWHERNLSEATLMAVDRSLVEALLGGGQTGRVQGVDLMYDRDRLRTQLAFTDGFNSINTKFYDSGGEGAGVGGGAGVTPTNFGISGRGEFLLIGNRTAQYNPFSSYDRQFTALDAKQDFLVLGAGADFSQAGANDVIFNTVDLQYVTAGGFSAYGAYLGTYRGLTTFQGVVPGYYYDAGFVVQAAYLITQQIEPFARFDYTYLANHKALLLATGEVQEITVGANYYFYRQNVKFTVDFSWLPQGAPSDQDALGILKDSGNNEFVLRTQLQLAF
jgi:hypothetical protein